MKCKMIFCLLCGLTTLIYCNDSDVPNLITSKIDEYPISNMLAGNLAMRHYITSDNALAYNLIHPEVSAIQLAFVIKDYANENQKLWEVKLFVGNSRKFIGMIYVHPENGECYFVIGD